MTAFLVILALYIHDRIVVDHYNKGCEYYADEDYTEAYNEFLAAQNAYPFGHDDCDTRINEVLSLLNRYDWSGNTIIDAAVLKQDLLTGREILLANGWARDDDVGRDVDAQKLKEDIDKLLEDVENAPVINTGNGGSSGNQNQDNSSSGGQDQNEGNESGGGQGSDSDQNSQGGQSEEQQREQKIEDTLQDIQQGSSQERAESQQQSEEWDNPMNFSFNEAIW